MRFSANTNSFKAAVDIVSHASSPGGMTPILENILMSVQYKKVVLTANNLEMAIEYNLDTEVDIQSEGSFTVSSRFITSFLSLVSEDRLTVGLVDDGALEFTTPSSNTKVKGLEAGKFPVIPGFQANEPLRIPANSLKKSIERTIFSTAEGNIRPTLAGICLQLREDGIVFASTDSFRLSEYILKGKIEHPPVSIIIPSKTAIELSRILPDTGDVELFASENQLLVVFGNIKVYSRLLNGHFPDYRNFFPKGYSTKGVVLRTDLVQALKRMNLITRENKYNTRLAFRAETGIEIFTGDTEIGAGRITIPSSIEGEDATIGLNATYLLDVLSVIKDDHVSIDFETALSPIMVQAVPAEDSKQSYKHIIMPLKI
ncbi:MAG: DNA polymerase III subunit beta [Candidatus Gracilibacteria bacterium]|nr:DNA polymerase III subunit beta [Candidatus Gracilibacteria bacterium]